MRRSSFSLAALLLWAVVLASPEPAAQPASSLWSPDGRVEGMALNGDTLYITGLFRRIGPPTGQLAVLDKTTGDAGLSYAQVDALATDGVLVTLLDGSGGYFVGGVFTQVSGRTRYNLAHVLPDGTLDPAFRPDPTLGDTTEANGGAVRALMLDAGVLYIGGTFDTIAGGQPRQALAALDAATGTVLPLQTTFAFPSTTSYRPEVGSLLVHAGVLYVGGVFEEVAGLPRLGLAAFDAATGALLPWRADLSDDEFYGAPIALALGDGTLYFTGFFDFVNGQRRFGTAEVTLADPTTGAGGTPTPWAPRRSGPDNLFGSDLVVVGDYVYVASGVPGGAVARINRTTAVAEGRLPGYGSAEALAYDPVGGSGGQGTLYVGAQQCTGAGGGDCYPIVASVDAATGQPTGFVVRGASEGNQVRTLAVEPGPEGRLFAGGDFLTFGAGIVRRQGLAALDLTTGQPTAFAANVSGPGQGLFEDLALSPDGRFLYGYSNIVGGAALDLTEFDLVTGATRQFVPQGLTAATYAASAHVAEVRSAQARATSSPLGARAAPNPRVENATSAVVVTDTGGPGGLGRVCVSLSGVACYDRASADLLFYTPFVTVAAGGENNGDLVYLPPGGPLGNPGGADGALVVAAPIEEAPVGSVHAAFVAVDVATGAVIEDWDVGFQGRGALGFSATVLDRDGPDGPAAPALYLGGDFFTFEGPTGPRSDLIAADVVTGAALPWPATVSGGPASALAMASHRAAGGRGVVYVGGTLFFANNVRSRSAVAFDAETGERLPWGENVRGTPRVLLVSKRLGAVFVGGSGWQAGTGHADVFALAPAAPLLPTAGAPGATETPRTASLALAGPNPLRNRTALSVSLPHAQAVEAALFDVLGRRVAVLHAGPLPAGVSRIAVDASALPAGIYLARVTAGTFTAALTLTVVR